MRVPPTIVSEIGDVSTITRPTEQLGMLFGAGTGLENINEMVGFADSRDLLDDKTTTLKDTPKL